jgi:hypothetical protein
MFFVWAWLFLQRKSGALGRRLFCAVASVQLILLAGLRHISIGPDTYTYKVNTFDPLITTPWSALPPKLWAGLLGQRGVVDPGFGLLVKGVQLLSVDYQVFLVVVAAAFIIPLGLLIYRYSPEPLMSFLIYSALFFNVYPQTAMRQTFALALVVLVGYGFIAERRLLPFLVLSAAAFTIHKSSICFLPFYFIAPHRYPRRSALAVIALVPVVYAFRVQVIGLLSGLAGYASYYGGPR